MNSKPPRKSLLLELGGGEACTSVVRGQYRSEAAASAGPALVPSGRGAVWSGPAQMAVHAAAEEMGRRAPGMMSNGVEPPDDVDSREGLYGTQLSRRDGAECRGAMVPLQGVEFLRCTLGVGERCGDLRGHAPADGHGLGAEGAFRGDRVGNGLCGTQGPYAQFGGATIIDGYGRLSREVTAIRHDFHEP